MSVTTSEAWGLAIAGIVGMVLALNQLGVDVPSALGAAMQGAEQLLNHSVAAIV